VADDTKVDEREAREKREEKKKKKNREIQKKEGMDGDDGGEGGKGRTTGGVDGRSLSMRRSCVCEEGRGEGWR